MLSPVPPPANAPPVDHADNLWIGSSARAGGEQKRSLPKCEGISPRISIWASVVYSGMQAAAIASRLRAPDHVAFAVPFLGPRHIMIHDHDCSHRRYVPGGMTEAGAFPPWHRLPWSVVMLLAPI